MCYMAVLIKSPHIVIIMTRLTTSGTLAQVQSENPLSTTGFRCAPARRREPPVRASPLPLASPAPALAPAPGSRSFELRSAHAEFAHRPRAAPRSWSRLVTRFRLATPGPSPTAVSTFRLTMQRLVLSPVGAGWLGGWVVLRIGIDLSRYDVITVTVLAAPLVCSDFQHDFGIVSSPVFKDLGVIIKQGRGPGSKDYLSFCDSPDIKTEMGHRSNGLPILYLVPNRLRRMQHRSLTPYTDAEGIRLLKEQWQYADNNSVYLAALDECYTTALLNGGPQRYLRDNMFLRSTSRGHNDAFVAEYKQTHRNNNFLIRMATLNTRIDLE